MNIGVIGYGFVGRATGEGFVSNPKNKVFWYDKFKESPNTLEEVVKKSDFVFVCVPTPIFEDYSGMDMGIVIGVVDQVAEILSSSAKATEDKVLIIKSTSLPGTAKKLAIKYPKINFIMNPEFLTQKNANHDFLNPSRTVIGAESKDVALKVIKIYKTILSKNQPYVVTDTTSAEVIKYMSNLMLASKVLLANEFYELSKKVGANYLDVQKAVESDPRIGTHLGVPGPDGDMGFGGACFPKDMVGILGLAKKLKLDVSALEAIWKKNLKVRKHRDWEEMPQAFKKDTK
ncbi:MAG: UDP-glucose/GDP-mannose dehydrogenase dimerization [Microgenomates group bacterium GW2011_GWC1_39_7b]|uniref:Nucleotide sugar dehydrogenase n=2 Tax=Candidatus Woeseibacteriota TaxID=1752722 RepID=A0A0G0UXN3_9BACT|nr:MAG: Nucleotide sugar dehydrogenase [Candidatus Woesebacteria bacterium GW2011_GWB1_39_10]KKR26163.1 MAG: UDP-glucose/GDP-mannose dehydrogenase dimerization [Microgenomates group bacterium GW2011_GWC1_39_7b]KKR92251.1 MAG: Nucleotide sugar dehydrogenase [Candidatus Woesebacteria bacterium GW2011_GWA1_41_13b]